MSRERHRQKEAIQKIESYEAKAVQRIRLMPSSSIFSNGSEQL